MVASLSPSFGSDINVTTQLILKNDNNGLEKCLNNEEKKESQG